MLVVAAAGLLLWLAVDRVLIPEKLRLEEASEKAAALSLRYATLARNLRAVKNSDAEWAAADSIPRQTDSDEITLCELLKCIEGAARRPNMKIMNIRPLPVANEGAYKLYQIDMSVTGKMQDVLVFLGTLASQTAATGVGSFHLRGLPGELNRVECALVIKAIYASS